MPATIPFPVRALLSAVLVLLAAVASFPGTFGISKDAGTVRFEQGEGFLLSAELPPGPARTRKRTLLFPEASVICENGVPLARPRSSEKEITNAGRGRYQVGASKLNFSTSDGGPAAERVYTIRAPMWSLRESLLLGFWLLAAVGSAILLRPPWPPGVVRFLQSQGAAYAALGASAVLAAGFFWSKEIVSDQFFLGVLTPALWAVLMGGVAGQRLFAGRIALMVLALLPALAGYFYYGLNAASDSSFLAAGIIPCSDARLHFQQAAEIAIQGTTGTLFNGRFLYPAFYAVALDLAGLNVLVANLLVSSLVMLGLAFTCPMVARRIGMAGTAIYCLFFWLYFRAHGCGLLMTENAGLLLGVVGFGCLLLSVDAQKVRLVFAAIVFLGMGLVARPGAMFVLPALAVYAGIRVWMVRPGRLRLPASVGAVLLGIVLIAGCFGANELLMKSLSRGEGKTFGNFAFTLHGLLNDTNWKTSADGFGGDTTRVMEHNIRQIKESPVSLIRGVGRAYMEAFDKGFLFRFGKEKRFAGAGMAAFFLAVCTCWWWPPLRRDAWWIFPVVAGILASIPFAPPWDAGDRPYAATVPVQIFLAAAGFSILLSSMRWLANRLAPRDAMEFSESSKGSIPAAFAGFASLCFLLVLPVPLALRIVGFRSPVPPQAPAFLPGSQRLVAGDGGPSEGMLSRNQFLDRLSDFQAAYPEEALFFTSEPGEFLLAINWSNLEPVVLPTPQELPGVAK